VIVCASLFIVGYLARYGGAAYGREQAVALPAPAVTPTPAPTAHPAAPTVAAPSEPAVSAPAPAPVTPPPAGPKPAIPAGPRAPTAVQTPPVTAETPATPAAPTTTEGSRIEFDESEFDFGQVWQEQSVTHEFAFRNAGTAPLTVSQVIATCSCAVGTPPASPIAPGGTGVIKVAFNPGRLRDRVTKHIIVVSSDPASPRTTLTVVADVKMEVDIAPSGIYFGTLHLGQTLSRDVLIRPAQVKKFRLLDVKSSDPEVAVAAPVPAGKGEPEGTYRVTITVSPTAKARRLSAQVTVRTDLAYSKVITIAVYGRIVAEPQEAPVAPNTEVR